MAAPVTHALTVCIVAQHLLADAAGPATLDLMLVAEHRHARAPQTVVQQRPATGAMRQDCDQRALAAVHAASHCTRMRSSLRAVRPRAAVLQLSDATWDVISLVC